MAGVVMRNPLVEVEDIVTLEQSNGGGSGGGGGWMEEKGATQPAAALWPGVPEKLTPGPRRRYELDTCRRQGSGRTTSTRGFGADIKNSVVECIRQYTEQKVNPHGGGGRNSMTLRMNSGMNRTTAMVRGSTTSTWGIIAQPDALASAFNAAIGRENSSHPTGGNISRYASRRKTNVLRNGSGRPTQTRAFSLRLEQSIVASQPLHRFADADVENDDVIFAEHDYVSDAHEEVDMDTTTTTHYEGLSEREVQARLEMPPPPLPSSHPLAATHDNGNKNLEEEGRQVEVEASPHQETPRQVLFSDEITKFTPTAPTGMEGGEEKKTTPPTVAGANALLGLGAATPLHDNEKEEEEEEEDDTLDDDGGLAFDDYGDYGEEDTDTPAAENADVEAAAAIKEKKPKRPKTTPYKREHKVFAARKSLSGAGLHEEAGIRRSTRQRVRPLEWWRNEKKNYGRDHVSLPTVVSVDERSPDLQWPRSKTKPRRKKNPPAEK